MPYFGELLSLIYPSKYILSGKWLCYTRLYDLYVESDARKSGIGEALMDRAAEFAKEAGASRIDLLTDFDNKPGQRLYEKLGYKITNETFHSYSLQL